MVIDLEILDARWDGLNVQRLADQAVAAVLAHLDIDQAVCEIAILACDDARIAGLNSEFRDKSVPTNVLSWPAQTLASSTPGGKPARPEPDFSGEMPLGDIAIAYETCAAEAAAAGKPMAEHVTHLVVHGLLHLLGYDHIGDPDADLMEALEIRILGKLGVDDPYREQDGP